MNFSKKTAWRVICLLAVSLCSLPCGNAVSLDFDTTISVTDGKANLEAGRKLFDERDYDRAAMHFWRAVLMQKQDGSYQVEEAFNPFMQCFQIQNRMADGFVYIAQESIGRGQYDMGKMYLQQALAVDEDNEDALALKEQLELMGQTVSTPQTPPQKPPKRKVVDDDDGNGDDQDDNDDEFDEEIGGKSPEQLYEVASTYFSDRDYESCADFFEISCQRSNQRLGPSCANAVYCRSMIVDWGFNGTGFEQDMKRIQSIVKMEKSQFRQQKEDGGFQWSRAASPHPHMMLGYPIEAKLKRYVSEAAAFVEDLHRRYDPSLGSGQVKPLPDDMPFDAHAERAMYVEEASKPGAKIRIAFVASAFNSKAVLYLSHDMFRFFNKNEFEVHVFSLGPPDNPLFIKHGMKGVDWRERVKANCDVFHDVQEYRQDHIGLARYIHEQKIHILMEWDGYARQGERAQGLFTLRPAPVQIWHQEYLGTSGAQYVDYLFSDKITSPPQLQHLYVEKLIYLPNHFFSKGHAVQSEVRAPSLDYPPKQTPYKPGSGSPQINRCMAPKNKGPKKPSFVFCNFNKFLKNNPATVRSWIRILREVPDSILCLLENPKAGLPYFRKFVHEAAGSRPRGKQATEETLIHGDGDDLNDRIHFLPWNNNPFEHQMRNMDFCNVMLDSYPYNGHTTAQDALYAGVPIVTRSDGDDMSSRVSTSANIVLGLEELNAVEGPRQYEDIAIELGNDPKKFRRIRTKLIETALQRNPMHPYWDVARYVKNFEGGLRKAWEIYLNGDEPQHITVEETEEAQRGTYDDVLLNNPPDGKKTTHDGGEL